MSKILDAQGILADARSCVECIYMAAHGLGGGLEHEGIDPIQVVADIANKKIEEAIALLGEYRNDMGDAPVPATPSAKSAGRAEQPKSSAARTKRKGK